MCVVDKFFGRDIGVKVWYYWNGVGNGICVGKCFVWDVEFVVLIFYYLFLVGEKIIRKVFGFYLVIRIGEFKVDCIGMFGIENLVDIGVLWNDKIVDVW